MQLTASPNVRCISNSVRMSAAQGSDVSCHKRHFAPQQTAFYSLPRWIPKCSGSNLPRIREDRSTLPIENQSFVNRGEGVLSLDFLFEDLTQYQE
jgi:hypothetical protein